MNYFRYFLMVVSGIAGVCSLVAAKTSSFRGEEAFIIFLIGALCSLNFIYLVQAPAPNSRPNRITRMIALWFAAKEADLKRRATGAD